MCVCVSVGGRAGQQEMLLEGMAFNIQWNTKAQRVHVTWAFRAAPHARSAWPQTGPS